MLQTSTSVFVVKMDGRARGRWWGTSECTTVVLTLMVRFGVGMGWANSEFLNVKHRQGSRPPSSNVKVDFEWRQDRRPATSSSSSSSVKPTVVKLTVKQRQVHAESRVKIKSKQRQESG